MSRIIPFPVAERLPVSAPLVPVVPLRGRVPDDIDELLSNLGRDPRASNPAWRNALLFAYWPVLSRICRKCWWECRQRGLIDCEDVEQEGVLAFFELLGKWSGEGSLTRYLLGRFRWRVKDRIRQLTASPLNDYLAATLLEMSADSYQAELALSLLQELIDPLPPFDKALVTSRVLDGRSHAATGRLLGVSTSTIEKRWKMLQVDLYRNLQLLLNNIE